MKLSWYFDAYGRGANSKVNGDSKSSNPFLYGTKEYDAWNDGWRESK